jgi:hypothetical protein
MKKSRQELELEKEKEDCSFCGDAYLEGIEVGYKQGRLDVLDKCFINGQLDILGRLFVIFYTKKNYKFTFEDIKRVIDKLKKEVKNES